MKTYARIQDGAVFELLETDGDITEMFPPSLVWIDVTGVSPVPAEGWTYAAGAFAAPAVVVSDLWAAHHAAAQAALDASDMTAIRCMKAGVAFPAAWLAYCQALRVIVAAATGDATTDLPTMPAYPAGT